MNILLHMCDPYPNECPCAKRMGAFYEVLTAKGHSVKVLAPGTIKNKSSDSDIYYCPTVALKKKTQLRRILNGVVFGITSFFISLRFRDVDIVLTTTPPPMISVFGWLIAKQKHARLVYDVRDIWPDVAWEMGQFLPGSFRSRVFAWIRDFMLNRADLVTTVSPGKIEKLKGYAPKAQIAYIPNGLDEGFLRLPEDQALVEQFQLDAGFTCVYCGNLGLAQGLQQLLELAERAKTQYPAVRFLLFGTGVEEKQLRDYVQDHALSNVQFGGRLPNCKMYTVLRHASMSFVSLSSDRLQDSVPTKMFEALGAGCPVLLAAAGDAADVLNECRLGIAVKPRDSEAIWKAFERMYNHPEEFRSQKEFARNMVLQHYSRQKAAAELEKQLLLL